MKGRDLHLDSIRILLVVSVLVIHTFNHGVFLSNFDILKLSFLFHTERLFRFAVPLFFIVSGYSLALRYQKPPKLKEYFYKRSVRLLIPYFVWSLLYSLYGLRAQDSSFSIGNFIASLFYGNAGIHLYFIPALYIVNILFPFILGFKKYFTYSLMAILFGFGIVFQGIDYYLFPWPILAPLRIALLNFPLFVLGMYSFFHKHTLQAFVRKHIQWVIVSCILLYYAIVEHTANLYVTFHKVDFINSQWQPLILLYSAVVWFLLFSLKIKSLNNYSLTIIFMSKLTLFVYYSHIIVMSIFWRLWGSYLFNASAGKVLETYWFIPLSLAFVVAFCFILASIVYFIPRLNGILGIEK